MLKRKLKHPPKKPVVTPPAVKPSTPATKPAKKDPAVPADKDPEPGFTVAYILFMLRKILDPLGLLKMLGL